MKLTTAQLGEIKTFINKRGFKQFDLQMEILDHVACKVEEKMTDNPEMSFEKALLQTHAEFGVFGFSTVEDSMREALSRQYRNLRRAELRNWLAFPRVFLVLGYAFLAFYAFMALHTNILLVMTITVCIAAWITAGWTNHRLVKRHGKTMASEVALTSTVSYTILLHFFAHFSRFMDQSPLWAILYAMLLLLLAFSFRSLVVVQRQVKKRYEELFAKYE